MMRGGTRWIVRVKREPKEKLPTIDSMHRDIGFANEYRLELIKHVLTISAALFAFTATFRPTLDAVQWHAAMWIGWAGLALSMIGGIFNMLGWENYYKSYHDYDWKLRDHIDPGHGRSEGRKRRKVIELWRGRAMMTQFYGFAIGVLGVGAFAGINIDGTHKGMPSVVPVCVSTVQAQRCDGGIARSQVGATSKATSTSAGKP